MKDTSWEGRRGTAGPREAKTVKAGIWATVVSLAVASTLLLGCGSITTPTPASSSTGSSTTGSGAPSTSASPYAKYYTPKGSATIQAGQPLSITAGDFYFQPNTLTVAKGTAVTLEVKNVTSIPHNFTVDQFKVNVALPAGQTTKISFTPSQTGTYYFYCAVSGHAEAGMVGELIVR